MNDEKQLKLDRISELEHTIVQLEKQYTDRIHRLTAEYEERIRQLEIKNLEMQTENDKMIAQLRKLGLL